MRHAVSACVAVAVLASTGSVALAAQQVYPLRKIEDGRYTLDVRIDGSVPLPFIVDTGASHSAIPLFIASKLGFETENADLWAVDALTEQTEAPRHIVDFQLGGERTRRVEPIVVDIEADSTLGGFGLLGADFFQGNVIRLDFNTGSLTMDAQTDIRADGAIPGHATVLTAKADVAGLDREVDVLIDTGSPVSLISPALQRSLYDRNTLSIYEVSGVTGHATRIRRERRIRSIRLGNLCLENVRMPQVNLHVFQALGWSGRSAMLLGLDFLEGSSMVIDYDNGVFQIDGPGSARCESVRTPR